MYTQHGPGTSIKQGLNTHPAGIKRLDLKQPWEWVFCIPIDTESHLSRSSWVKSNLSWWGRDDLIINSGVEAHYRSLGCISIHLLSADSSKPCLVFQIHRNYNSQRCADYELTRQLLAQSSFPGRGLLWGSGSLWSTLQNSIAFSFLQIKHVARAWLRLGIKSMNSDSHSAVLTWSRSFNSANPHFCHHRRGRVRIVPTLSEGLKQLEPSVNVQCCYCALHSGICWWVNI